MVGKGAIIPPPDRSSHPAEINRAGNYGSAEEGSGKDLEGSVPDKNFFRGWEVIPLFQDAVRRDQRKKEKKKGEREIAEVHEDDERCQDKPEEKSADHAHPRSPLGQAHIDDQEKAVETHGERNRAGGFRGKPGSLRIPNEKEGDGHCGGNAPDEAADFAAQPFRGNGSQSDHRASHNESQE